MTVKELYEEALRLGREDWTINVCDYYGTMENAERADWDTYADREEVAIRA